MAVSVRIFGHRGLEQMPRLRPMQHSEDSVYSLSQPYEFAQTLSADVVAVSSSPIADVNSGAAVNILNIEIEDAKSIRYEINPPGRAVSATVNSPKLSGNNQFYFKSGWTISVIDASSVAS